MKDTEKHMTDKIKIAKSIMYGRYCENKDRSIEISKIFTMAMKHARKIMNLPESLQFEIRPIRGNVTGYYNNSSKTIALDPRDRTLGAILSTIMHELVHAEQYHTGRLVNKEGVHTWNNEMSEQVSAIVSSASYKKYRTFPWEVEAYSRQEELATRVAAMIKEEENV